MTCGCARCITESNLRQDGEPIQISWMIVCPVCGSKRCPKADDHRNDCTNTIADRSEMIKKGKMEMKPEYRMMQVRDTEQEGWFEIFVLHTNPNGSCVAVSETSYGAFTRGNDFDTVIWSYCREIPEPNVIKEPKDTSLEKEVIMSMAADIYRYAKLISELKKTGREVLLDIYHNSETSDDLFERAIKIFGDPREAHIADARKWERRNSEH